MSSISKYNFAKNLFSASFNKTDINEAKTEWFKLCSEKLSNYRICICNHKIRNITYFS